MALAPVLLTAEQFSQLPTKDYIDRRLDERLKNVATKDDLKNFATKDDFKKLDKKIDSLSDKLDLRFGQLDYKLETSFDALNCRLDEANKKHDLDIHRLKWICDDHSLRLKKLESWPY